MNRKTLRPPVKWHGGKYYLARRIVEHFPPHHTYLEPFGGAASVLLNKPPSLVEVYNDLDGRITRLLRVLRDHGEEFRRQLSLTPYSEIEFQEAATPAEDEIEQARRDFVRWRLSLGGRGDSYSFTLHRARRRMADVVSGYLSTIDEQLPMIVERLRTVEILRRPAMDVIRKWDSPETLVYCDPLCGAPHKGSNKRSTRIEAGNTTRAIDYLRFARGVVSFPTFPPFPPDAVLPGRVRGDGSFSLPAQGRPGPCVHEGERTRQQLRGAKQVECFAPSFGQTRAWRDYRKRPNQPFFGGPGFGARSGNPWRTARPLVMHIRFAAPVPAQRAICRYASAILG